MIQLIHSSEDEIITLCVVTYIRTYVIVTLLHRTHTHTLTHKNVMNIQ